MSNNRIANSELKSLLKSWRETYLSICEQSRGDYVLGLKPGEKIPASGKIYTAAGRESLDASAEEYREKAHRILDAEIKAARETLTAAPSTDAVNIVSMLKHRNDLTSGEVGALLEQYGENVLTHRALIDIARNHRIFDFDDHPIEAHTRNLEDLSRNLDRTFTARSAMESGTNPGYLGFLEMAIDNCFPDD